MGRSSLAWSGVHRFNWVRTRVLRLEGTYSARSGGAPPLDRVAIWGRPFVCESLVPQSVVISDQPMQRRRTLVGDQHFALTCDGAHERRLMLIDSDASAERCLARYGG